MKFAEAQLAAHLRAASASSYLGITNAIRACDEHIHLRVRGPSLSLPLQHGGALSTLPAMRLPPPLTAGARVALVAPAGPLRSRDELDVATAQARAFGWEPVIAEHALSKHGYLAGSDAERLHDLNAALTDRNVDGIWCLRGGYGAMRLLEGINVDAMRSRPRALIGYSDITALHAAFVDAADVVTYHGPTARTYLSDFARDSLERAVVFQRDPCGASPTASVVRGGRAEGRLVGGNLALLAALCGTRFAPNYADAILIIEDVGEATYRVDRMLRQLALSGALSRLAGIVFGRFTDGTDPTDASSCALDDVLREVADHAGVPTISGAPIGHVADQWTIPLGAMAELDADNQTLHVALA
ncbi:MAG: LD-carboxypeptidase [bacterium]